ncbi:MAG: PIN domain-containing protein [Chloroflexi bacterium]|nr:MAG: PIN domain-containing protein [Chloroflexota bacterium]
MPYVVDTHALAWHFANSPSLGNAARWVLSRADSGIEIVYVPSIVLGELMHICARGRTSLSFADTLARIESGDNYHVIPLDLAVINAASAIQSPLEMHDLFIVATAKMLDAAVITKDAQIVASGEVTIVW